MAQALTARNADLPDIVAILQAQRARRLDLVVNAAAIHALDGNLVVADLGEVTQVITGEGVTSAAGVYRPTTVCDEGIGTRLGIHGAYLKSLRVSRPDLWDANVNGMLHGGTSALAPAPDFAFPGFAKNIMLRLLSADGDEPGVARAFLSPGYKIIDNLDVLLAIMDGIKQAGIDAIPSNCDLSDRRMFARFEAPQIAALAPRLLDGYRSPFDRPGGPARAGDGDRPGMRLQVEHGGWEVADAMAAAAREGMGYKPGEEPIVWAGLVVSNSDVGGGARTIAPQIRVRVCKNGLTVLAEADRKIHLGTAHDTGVIQWSADTMEQELRLITSQARDAVQTFLSQEYLDAKVAEIEALASVVIAEPEPTIKSVGRSVGYSDAEAAKIMEHFLMGGSHTAGGLAGAITSYSQTVASPDRAAELDALAVKAMAHAARTG